MYFKRLKRIVLIYKKILIKIYSVKILQNCQKKVTLTLIFSMHEIHIVLMFSCCTNVAPSSITVGLHLLKHKTYQDTPYIQTNLASIILKNASKIHIFNYFQE